MSSLLKYECTIFASVRNKTAAVFTIVALIYVTVLKSAALLFGTLEKMLHLDSYKNFKMQKRRQSIKQVQKTAPKGAHELMTQANYRTEIQALKMAQKRETCSCARNCFALCNIYI